MTTIDTHVVSLGECAVFHEWTTTRKISDWSMLWEFEEFEQRGSILHELAPIFGWTKWPGLTKQTFDKPTAITTIGIRGSVWNWLLGFFFFLFLYWKVTKCFVIFFCGYLFYCFTVSLVAIIRFTDICSNKNHVSFFRSAFILFSIVVYLV